MKVSAICPVVAMSIITGLIGCADQHVWCNPDASSQQMLTQVHACSSGNVQSNPDKRPVVEVNTDPHALRTVSGNSNGSGVDPFEVEECMKKSGYQYVTQKQCDSMVPTRAPARCSLGAICVDEAPPPPKTEPIGTAAVSGSIWMPGYYVYYDKTGYQWAEGHWEPGRPGSHWHAPHWEHVGSKWIFIAGYWQRDN